jgi:hypothetical protein
MLHDGDQILAEWRMNGGTPFTDTYHSFFPDDPCPLEANGASDIIKLTQRWTPHDFEEWRKVNLSSPLSKFNLGDF